MSTLTFCKGARRKKGYTLIEVSLVLGLSVALGTAGFLGVASYWKLGAARKAQTVLTQVDVARVSWLLDNPQKGYPDVTIDKLLPFMPDPNAISTLTELGYSLENAGLQSEDIWYTKTDQDLLPIPGFNLGGS